MYSFCDTCFLALETPARFGMPAAKLALGDNCLSTAFAFTKPKIFTTRLALAMARHCYKPAKF